MGHEQDNLFEKEDYRYKIYELFRELEDGKLSLESLREKLTPFYQEILEGALSKSEQLSDKKNPFFMLWDNALQAMSLSEYEASTREIQECWSDFMDYFFSMWYLRRAEKLLNKKSEPLYK